MDTIAAAFGLPVGYSDHTEGLSVAVAAVARGATVLEKHLTLDRARPGPDHAASLDPSEFAQMVAAVRATESSLGDPQKRPGTGELGVREVARRSLVAARAVRAGKVLTEEDLVALRPDGGTHPGELWRLVGTRAPRDLAAGESLKPTA